MYFLSLHMRMEFLFTSTQTHQPCRGYRLLNRLIGTSATRPSARRTATAACRLPGFEASPITSPALPRTVSTTVDPGGKRASTSSGRSGKQKCAAWCASSDGVANVMKQCAHRVSGACAARARCSETAGGARGVRARRKSVHSAARRMSRFFLKGQSYGFAGNSWFVATRAVRFSWRLHFGARNTHS